MYKYIRQKDIIKKRTVYIVLFFKFFLFLCFLKIQCAMQNSVLLSQIDLANLTRLRAFRIRYPQIMRPKGAQIQQAKNTNPINCRGREKSWM